MKTYNDYNDIPSNAHYLGSEHGDGSMDESLADNIDSAINPVRLRDEGGTFSYFDVAKETQ